MKPFRSKEHEPAGNRREPERTVETPEDPELEERLQDLDPRERGAEVKGGFKGIANGDGG